MVGCLARDDAVIVELRKVAHAPEHPVCDTRRAARARGDLARAAGVDVHTEQRRRACDDAAKLLGGVQLQPQLHAEAVAQGA